MRRPTRTAAVLSLVLIGCTSGAPGGQTARPAVGTPSSRPTSTQAASPVPTATERPSETPSPSPTPLPSPSPPPDVSSAWTALDATGPPAREDHTFTTGPDGSAWLFGGRDGATVHGDLWRLDFATDEWSRIEVDGPAPEARFGHTATWVDGIGLVVWAGQADPTAFFDDLWAWEPVSGEWRELPAEGDRPLARYGSCAALGPDGRLWVSHGFTSEVGRFDDTWAYDFDAAEWSEETLEGGPFIRCLHDCLWTPDDRLLLYGGQTTGAPAVGDLWTRPLDGAWSAAPTPPAPPRQLYAIGVRGDDAWIFGGAGTDRSRLGDLWRLDLVSLAWQPVAVDGPAPSARSGGAFARDERGDRLLLFGGLTDVGASAETWALTFTR